MGFSLRGRVFSPLKLQFPRYWHLPAPPTPLCPSGVGGAERIRHRGGCGLCAQGCEGHRTLRYKSGGKNETCIKYDAGGFFCPSADFSLLLLFQQSAERCVSTLLDLIQTKVNYVVQEAIVVIRDIFRKYPNK